jgi:hypothetical protein
VAVDSRAFVREAFRHGTLLDLRECPCRGCGEPLFVPGELLPKMRAEVGGRPFAGFYCGRCAFGEEP